MVSNEDDARISRRSVLRGTAAALGVGTGFAGAGAAGAGAASEGVRGGGRTSAQGDAYEGFVCGAGLSDGDSFTVEPRCDDGCEVIRATGLTPDCSGGIEDLYVNLEGTDPTVWVTPSDRRVGSITPGTYRIVGAERCGGDAPACDGAALYRVQFRSEGDGN